MSKKRNPIATYLDMLSKNIAKDLVDDQIQLSDNELQVGYETLYSRTSLRNYYIITALPEYINTSWYHNIRKVVAELPVTNQVLIDFLVKGVPHTIDWNSREMKTRKAMWEQAEHNRPKSDDVFEDAESRHKSSFEDWRIESWRYVQNAEERKTNIIDCEMTIEVCTNGTTKQHKDDLRSVCRRLEQYLSKMDISFKKVRNRLPDFLKYISMTSLDNTTYTAKTLPNRLLSNEILSNMLSYTPGRINDTGVLFGIDVVTGMAAYKNMVRSNGEAENFIVLAETGGGKSFYMKALAIQMALNNFHQIVLDIDGEYRPIAEALNGVVVNMNKGAGLYFDSTIISALTGDEETDNALCTDSRTSTASVFSLLCNVQDGMTPTEERLFNIAYNNLYVKYGISATDKSTWSKSSQLSFHKLYQEICDLSNDTTLMSNYADEIRTLKDKLFVFFDKDGMRNYLFQKPISLHEILAKNTNLPMFIDIVLNLTTSEDANSRETLEDSLKQITASYLITLITNYYKSRDQFSVHYIEEYQRYSTNKRVESLVVYMVTGNRKRNACTFIISNSPKMLIGLKSGANMAVIDNINNYIIGALKPKTIDMVCDEFGLTNCSTILHKIASDPDFQHTFLFKINNLDTTIVRQSLPKAIIESPIFKTRTVKQKEVVYTENYME